jgi:beta-lactamase regulating signal transducer with metallopeptidase domain
MIDFAAWFSPNVLRSLGWALVHFIWQGLALAALFSAVASICRSASVRYVLALTTLLLMLTAPVLTFTMIWYGSRTGLPLEASSTLAQQGAGLPEAAPALADQGAPALQHTQTLRGDMLPWLVEAWFAGIVLFGLRAAGGLMVVEHLRHKESTPVSAALLEKCLALQRQLGLDRVIKYCQSRRLDAPAVIGWFRPVVLLPITALTGLSEQQLETVIAHELAHIRRNDCFVNFLQIVAESLLFYHPAVWWVSKRIRVERENCCDDAAVLATGGVLEYARALALMEEWRAAPALAMAANRHPLLARVARLLGVSDLQGGMRNAGVAAAILCLAAALAGNSLLALTQGPSNPPLTAPALPADAVQNPAAHLSNSTPSGRDTNLPRATQTMHKPDTETASVGKREKNPNSVPRTIPTNDSTDNAQESQNKKAPEPGKQESFIAAMKAAGLENLTVDQLIMLKIQGVTPEYVRGIHDLGLKTDVNELIGLKIQGVTPEYIRDMRALGLNAGMREFMGMRIQGVTPEYVRGMHDLGLKADANELVGLKIQGVTPEYIRDMRALGLDGGAGEFVGMRIQRVTPEYVRGVRAELGLNPKANELIGMRIQGVTPEYIHAVRAAGLKPSTQQLVAMKIHGVSPEYITALQKSGVPDFKGDPGNYITARIHGITSEFIEKARQHGFQNLDLEKLIALKHEKAFD